MCILAEGEVLNDRGVLVVITAEYHSLEGKFTVFHLLKSSGNETLDFGNLGGLLHDHIVIVEAQIRNLLTSHRRMCRGHCNHTSFFYKQVISLVSRLSQDFKRSNVF